MLDREAGGLDDGAQLLGSGEVALVGVVGPRQRIAEFATIARRDVPQCKSAIADKDAACFAIEAGLIGHVHLNMLAEYHVKSGVGERQFGDVGLLHGDPIVQPDEPVEPTSRFAVLFGEIDGGHPAPAPVGEEAGGTADTAAGVQHMVVAGDSQQLRELAGGDAPHGVEILERREVRRLKVCEFQTCGDERALDVVP